MKRRACLLILILFASCQPAAVSVTQTLSPPQIVIETFTPIPTDTPEPQTPTITPIPFLMYPYTIQGLRERQYHGGSITILSAFRVADEFTSYLISYPSDGLTITGVMQIPAGEGSFPVILMNHGYISRSAYSSGDGTDRAAEYLVRRGYITLSSDYRSWGGSDIGFSFFHTGLVIDVINLMNAVSSIPQADAARIGMWGHSMGGGITTKILTIDSRVKAAVLYAPNSADDADLIARWGYGCIGDVRTSDLLQNCNAADVIPSDLSPDLIEVYQSAALDPQMLRLIAPIHYLDLVSAPVQIHIGSADGDFIGSTPPEWSYKLNQALLDAGKNVELYQYEGERHSFIGDAWLTFMNRAVRFFDEQVK